MSGWTPPSPDEDPDLWQAWRESGSELPFDAWWLAGFEADGDEPGDDFEPDFGDELEHETTDVDGGVRGEHDLTADQVDDLLMNPGDMADDIFGGWVEYVRDARRDGVEHLDMGDWWSATIGASFDELTPGLFEAEFEEVDDVFSLAAPEGESGFDYFNHLRDIAVESDDDADWQAYYMAVSEVSDELEDFTDTDGCPEHGADFCGICGYERFVSDATPDDEEDDPEEGELLTRIECSFGPHHWGDLCHACGYGADDWGDITPGDIVGNEADELDHLENEFALSADAELTLEDRVRIAAWMDDENRSEWWSDTNGVISFEDWLLADEENESVRLDEAWDTSKWLFRGVEGDLSDGELDIADIEGQLLREDLVEWEQVDPADIGAALEEFEAPFREYEADQSASWDGPVFGVGGLADQSVLEEETTDVVDVDQVDVEDFDDPEVRAELWDAELAERGNEWGWDGWQDSTGDPGWGGDSWGGDGWGDGKFGDSWGGEQWDFSNSFDWSDW